MRRQTAYVMQSRVRAYTARDYRKLRIWWKQAGHPAVPACLLPPFGFVVDDIAAGFLTEGTHPTVELIVSDRAADPGDRKHAVEFLIDCLLSIAATKAAKRGKK